MESNHRYLGVGQVSLPLDHGAVFLKWSHRESHPDLQRAELASSCWTMTPWGNDEIQMTSDERRPFFGIRALAFLRHLAFDIRHYGRRKP